MNGFVMGSAMGLMVGAGMMLAPASVKLRREVMKKAGKMKRWIKNM